MVRAVLKFVPLLLLLALAAPAFAFEYPGLYENATLLENSCLPSGECHSYIYLYNPGGQRQYFAGELYADLRYSNGTPTGVLVRVEIGNYNRTGRTVQVPGNVTCATDLDNSSRVIGQKCSQALANVSETIFVPNNASGRMTLTRGRNIIHVTATRPRGVLADWNFVVPHIGIPTAQGERNVTFDTRVAGWATWYDGTPYEGASYHFRLDESTGKIVDAINQFNATENGTVTRGAEGLMNKSHTTVGSSNGWVIALNNSRGTDVEWPYHEEFTICMWMNLSGDGGSQANDITLFKLNKNSTNPGKRAQLFHRAGDQFLLQLGTAAGQNSYSVDGVNLQQENWTSLCFQRIANGGGYNCSIYRDDVAFMNVSCSYTTVGVTNRNSSTYLCDGNNIEGPCGSGTHNVHGAVDGITYWNYSLSRQNLTAYHNNGYGFSFPAQVPSSYNVTITDPTTAFPRSVTDGQNVAINFTFTKDGANITTNHTLNVTDIAIGGLSCPVTWGPNLITPLAFLYDSFDYGGSLGNFTTTSAGYRVQSTVVQIGANASELNSSQTSKFIWTNPMNISNCSRVTVDFWTRDDDLEAADIQLSFNDSGNNWDVIANLGGFTEDIWFRQVYDVNDSQYFHSFFSARWGGSTAAGENHWLDDVRVTCWIPGPNACFANRCQVNCTAPNGLTGLQNLSVTVRYEIDQVFATNTSTSSIDYGGAAADSCTYPGSGDWAIQCSHNCNITTNVNLGGNDLLINGTGTTTFRANVTNIATKTRQGACGIICTSQGCLK